MSGNVGRIRKVARDNDRPAEIEGGAVALKFALIAGTNGTDDEQANATGRAQLAQRFQEKTESLLRPQLAGEGEEKFVGCQSVARDEIVGTWAGAEQVRINSVRQHNSRAID